MKDFAAIDFETANSHYTSACSVGVVFFRDGEKVGEYYSLIRPEPNYYCYFNTQIHGLAAEDTADTPLFPDVWAQVEALLEKYGIEGVPSMNGRRGLPLVAHNKSFDERCLQTLFRCYQMDYPDYRFYCTLLRSRQVWPEGHHNLDIIAARCGYDLAHHHHALADADACAAIALKIL